MKLQKVIAEEFIKISDGSTVAKTELVNFLPVKSNSSNQGTDRKVLTMTIKVDNIIEMRHGGEVYKIID